MQRRCTEPDELERHLLRCIVVRQPTATVISIASEQCLCTVTVGKGPSCVLASFDPHMDITDNSSYALSSASRVAARWSLVRILRCRHAHIGLNRVASHAHPCAVRG